MANKKKFLCSKWNKYIICINHYSNFNLDVLKDIFYIPWEMITKINLLNHYKQQNISILSVF